ncbi:hypothetical protein PRIPAC_82503, partial [Pristionchus pacificus]|uniref:Uncharacterized protein n=1 Tax=Pristionchus pacificus TaxID=54126 RepID=A0A2A6C4I5_PRIPA
LESNSWRFADSIFLYGLFQLDSTRSESPSKPDWSPCDGIQACISRSKIDFRVWRAQAHGRLQHTPGFFFDLQWDSICVQLRQQSYREPREQDSFSSHCDCDKERRPIHWPETPQNDILKEERPSDTPS